MPKIESGIFNLLHLKGKGWNIESCLIHVYKLFDSMVGELMVYEMSRSCQWTIIVNTQGSAGMLVFQAKYGEGGILK